uniref:Uncharacterized protein n=1 Tax=mine drainage metagenome TaxID=410659 RepID=E6QRD9_9ZZZZ
MTSLPRTVIYLKQDVTEPPFFKGGSVT